MSYSIGVVTYHARYDKHFVPLMNKLVSIFPDKEILCVVNGHPDKTLQTNYLNKITAFLSKFKNVRFLTYEDHQSLSKCWNQIIILSRTEKILIMNDDTQVTDLFRKEFEEKVLDKQFSAINLSWSHFLISKDVIRKAGWFDERLIGVGQEDGDMRLRMAMVGIPVNTTKCLGIHNYVVDQENPGWKNISAKTEGNKYAQANLELMRKKWLTIDGNPEIPPEKFKYVMEWNNSQYRFSPNTDEPTPLFYDLSCLDIKKDPLEKYDIYKENKSKIFYQKIFYSFVSLLKKVYKFIFSR